MVSMKLKLIRHMSTSVPSKISRSPTVRSAPGPQESTPIARAEAINTLDTLLSEGARPPIQLQLDPGLCDHSTTDEEIHELVRYWIEAELPKIALPNRVEVQTQLKPNSTEVRNRSVECK